MKFRSKPSILDAVQWKKEGLFSEAPPPWLVEALAKPPGTLGAVQRAGNVLYVWGNPTAPSKVEPGDWVVRADNGVQAYHDVILRSLFEPAA